jgi:vancomycin resistance protein YoaR
MTTTTETLPVTTLGVRLPRLRVLVAAFGLGLLAVIAAAGAGLYAFSSSHSGRIFPGVHVGTVDLSNLDRAAAATRLRDAYASYGQGQVLLTAGDIHETIGYANVGRAPDLEAMLDQAFAVGRTGSAPEQAVELIRTSLNGVTIQPLVTVDPKSITSELAALAARLDKAPVNATVVKTDRFTTTPSVRGRAVDQSAAATAVAAALREPAATTAVSLTLPVVDLAPQVSDEAANVVRAKAAAMVHSVRIEAGSENWTIAEATVRSWVKIGWANGAYVPILDTKQIKASLQPLAKTMARTVRDASFLVGKNGHIVGVTGSATGRRLDVGKMTAAIRTAVLGRATGVAGSSAALTPTFIVTQPKLSTAQARKSAPLMRQISTWVTYYQPGPHNGNGANISIPAMAIDGTVVAPGQWFSFWKTVGDVSLAKGYKLGGAIVDGHSVEGHTIGGGICSTSTTLFNSALRAGFQMGARKNHFYYIARYPKGLDATVYISDGGGMQDMTWRNDTPYPVLIRAYARPGIVRFTLYSVPTGRRVSFTAPTVRNYRPSTTVVQYTTSLPNGVRSQIEYEAAGFDSWVTRTVRDRSGRVVHRDVYYSHYARVVGVILVGHHAA